MGRAGVSEIILRLDALLEGFPAPRNAVTLIVIIEKGQGSKSKWVKKVHGEVQEKLGIRFQVSPPSEVTPKPA